MAVNRNKEHLVLFVEDKPYKDIMNGVTIKSLHTNGHCIDIKKPCGGWLKVFKELEKNLFLLQNNKCYILLLIDFDDTSDGCTENYYFNTRIKKLEDVVPLKYRNRVFLLGANYKESEALKIIFNLRNFEDIGKLLVEECPHGDLSHWQNIHLKCNLPEIERMKKSGVFDWLFK